MNVDEGWMLGRDPTTLEPVADPTAFPGGMKALGDNIHSLGFLYGLYTSRGVTQCARPEYASRCMHNPPNPAKGCEGTNGYEHTDGTWMVAQGADCEFHVFASVHLTHTHTHTHTLPHSRMYRGVFTHSFSPNLLVTTHSTLLYSVLHVFALCNPDLDRPQRGQLRRESGPCNGLFRLREDARCSQCHGPQGVFLPVWLERMVRTTGSKCGVQGWLLSWELMENLRRWKELGSTQWRCEHHGTNH